MTDHLKTLRELVATGEQNGARDCLVLELRAALLHKFRERTDEGKSFDGADLDSIMREYALTMAERADDIAAAANARDAIKALLAERDAMRAVVEAAKAFQQHETKCQQNQDAGKLKDHIVKRLELLAELYAALRDLETKEAEDA